MLNSFTNLFFPPVCGLCEKAVGRDALCAACADAIGRSRILGPSCGVCGVPFASTASGPHTCGECLLEPPPYVQAISACIYEGAALDAIHSFKYGGNTRLAAGLGALLRDAAVFRDAPGVAVPVPLHVERLRQRGFNQSLLLAREAARALSIKVDYTSLRRVRPTAAQTGLAARDRRRNVAAAFAVRRPDALRGRRVLLVDDVLTTGATVRECSKAMRAAGAEVYVLTLARAVRL
ncbi:MAG: ComF family protein [Deltaproteobacteria bacterium]|nr:ComF family protein [Deltaproteobacteria bacterium]